MWRNNSLPATGRAGPGSVFASYHHGQREPERRQPPRSCRSAVAVASMSTGVPTPDHQSSRPRDGPTTHRGERVKTEKREPATPIVKEFWAITDILDERQKRGKIQYLVQWADLDEATGAPYVPTWEPAANVTEDAILAWQQKPQSTQGTDGSSRIEQNKRALEIDHNLWARVRAKRRQTEGRNQTLMLDLQSTGEPSSTVQAGQQSAAGRRQRIELQLPRRAGFDPTEYQLVEDDHTLQEARFDSDFTVPDSQGVSDLTDSGPRTSARFVAESQHSTGETNEIPSRQLEPLASKPVSVTFESDLHPGHLGDSTVFVSQEPFDFDSEAGAPTPSANTAQISSEQAQYHSQASLSASDPAVRSGVSSQEAQVVPHSLSQPAGFQSQLHSERDFSVYSDTDVAPEASQQPSGPAPDSQNSSQALSELDGNSRVSSSAPLSHGAALQCEPAERAPDKSFGNNETEPKGVRLGLGTASTSLDVNVDLQSSDAAPRKSRTPERSGTSGAPPVTPAGKMDNSSATETPVSAKEKIRQISERNFAAYDEESNAANAASEEQVNALLGILPLGADQPMVDDFHDTLAQSLLAPSVEGDPHHESLEASHHQELVPELADKPHDAAPMHGPEESLFENAAVVTQYDIIPEQPATLDPSALTLSIENDIVGHDPDIVSHGPDIVSHGHGIVVDHENDDSGSASIPTDEELPSTHRDSSMEPATSANGGEEHFEGNILPYIKGGPDEYLLTLPLASNIRPEYVEIIKESNADLVAYNSAFTVPPYQTPDPELVAKLDRMFSRLFDICDLPPFLDTLPVMNPVQITKHLRNTNSKFAFVAEFLEILRRADSDKKVLILARPGQIIDLLNNLVDTEEYHHIRVHEGKVSESSDHKHPQVVMVASTTEDLSVLPTDYDVVIAFDHTFRHEQLPHTPAEADPVPVLVLVTTSSIQHINMRISDKIEPLGRKNYLMLALYASIEEMLNPDPSFHQAQDLAGIFANYIDMPNDEFFWSPQEIPEAIFQHIAASSQAQSQVNSGHSGLRLPSSRKRSLDESDDEAATKRPKIVQPKVLTTTSPVRNMPDTLRGLLGEHQAPDGKQSVTISVAKTKELAAKIAKLEAKLEETRVQREEFRELADRSQREVESWTASMKKIQPKFMAAVRDRGIFEKERNDAVKKQEQTAARLQHAQDENAELKQKNEKIQQDLSDSRQALLSGAPDTSKMAKMGIENEELRAKIAVLEKKMTLANNDRDYAQGQYQQASQHALESKREGDNMRQEIVDLTRRANDNVVAVNQTQARNKDREYIRILEEKKLIIQDLESKLKQAHNQLTTVRNGRRETRQTSVPRSPRLGVSSPRHQMPGRTSAVGGAVSRGGSPAAANTFEVPSNIASGIGSLFAGQQQGSGRYSHLRD